MWQIFHQSSWPRFQHALKLRLINCANSNEKPFLSSSSCIQRNLADFFENSKLPLARCTIWNSTLKIFPAIWDSPLVWCSKWNFPAAFWVNISREHSGAATGVRVCFWNFIARTWSSSIFTISPERKRRKKLKTETHFSAMLLAIVGTNCKLFHGIMCWSVQEIFANMHQLEKARATQKRAFRLNSLLPDINRKLFSKYFIKCLSKYFYVWGKYFEEFHAKYLDEFFRDANEFQWELCNVI